MSARVTKYHRVVSMGVDFIRGGSMCGGISINAEAGDFFDGLKSFKTAGGRRFRKKSQMVETFPDELTLRVRVITSPCTGPGDPRQKSGNLDRFDVPFIKSLSFEAFWKAGFEMNKADVEIFSEGEGREPSYLSADTVIWEYELRVDSKKVPLSDALVLNVIASNGNLISRFSLTL